MNSDTRLQRLNPGLAHTVAAVLDDTCPGSHHRNADSRHPCPSNRGWHSARFILCETMLFREAFREATSCMLLWVRYFSSAHSTEASASNFTRGLFGMLGINDGWKHSVLHTGINQLNCCCVFTGAGSRQPLSPSPSTSFLGSHLASWQEQASRRCAMWSGFRGAFILEWDVVKGPFRKCKTSRGSAW